jgi:two-component system response regulator NreC
MKTKKAKAVTTAEKEGPRICPHCGHILPAQVQRQPRAMPEELTDRQLAVLRMIAMGHTAQQIGDALQLSRRTVEFHRGAIMNKLGLRTTAELVIYAIAHRLMNLD